MDTLVVDPPSYQNASEQVQPRLISLDFGDGYTQIAVEGMNAGLMKANYTWENMARAKVVALVEFLQAHIGQFFYWTTPASDVGPQKWYVPKDGWRRIKSGPLTDTITVTFQEAATNVS